MKRNEKRRAFDMSVQEQKFVENYGGENCRKENSRKT